MVFFFLFFWFLLGVLCIWRVLAFYVEAIYASLSGTARLHGCYARMVYWDQAAPGEIAGKNKIRPLFLLFWFFCLVEILLNVSGV